MSSDRLESWKEISAYLRRGVTTVQRWEREEGLPVHRHDHSKRGSVYAFRSEIDAWRASRTRLPDQPPEAESPDTHADSKSDATVAIRSDPGRDRRRSPPVQKWIAAVVAIVAAAVVVVYYWPGSDTAAPQAATPPRTLAHGSFASLSPDGTRVVYMVLPDLYVRSIAGGGAQRLLKAPHAKPTEVDLYPAWSRDGGRIAFLREVRPWVHDLFVLDLETAHEQRLAQVYGHDLDWSADGTGLLVPDRHPSEDPFSIFLISSKTGERLRRVTSPRATTFGDTQCAVSPDGTRLAVARYVTDDQADVYVVPLDGSRERRITHDEQPIEGLEWTPDGRSILVASYRDGDLRLWQVSADGATPPRVVPGTDRGARHPSFSRARNRHVLSYTHQPMDDDIWRWETTDPGTPGAIIASSPRDDGPAVSPDGKKLAFLSSRTGFREIWVANADGTHPRQLTVLQGPQPRSPRWSPDGTRLVFTSATQTDQDVYVIGADGSGLRRVTYERSEEGNPTWSSDGRSIYFRSNRSGINQIWKMPVSGGSATLVTQGEGSEARESADGRRLYFVRGRMTPGLWTTGTNGGPETFVAPEVQEANWDLARDGVFYTRRVAGPYQLQIKHFDFATGQARVLRSLDLPGVPRVGFAASMDGRWVYWTQRTLANPSMMIVDSWR